MQGFDSLPRLRGSNPRDSEHEGSLSRKDYEEAHDFRKCNEVTPKIRASSYSLPRLKISVNITHMAAIVTVRRLRHEGSGKTVTARAYPENGHATSGMRHEVTSRSERKKAGKTFGRWISLLRRSNRNADFVIEDD